MKDGSVRSSNSRAWTKSGHTLPREMRTGPNHTPGLCETKVTPVAGACGRNSHPARGFPNMRT